jgi:hypothetical protein
MKHGIRNIATNQIFIIQIFKYLTKLTSDKNTSKTNIFYFFMSGLFFIQILRIFKYITFCGLHRLGNSQLTRLQNWSISTNERSTILTMATWQRKFS